jgi:hypothetical protein
MLLKKATEFFSSGNYDDAYELYQIAAERYGRKNFEYNLSACERKLGKEKGLSVDVKLSGKKEATSLVNKYFDNVYLTSTLSYLKQQMAMWARH